MITYMLFVLELKHNADLFCILVFNFFWCKHFNWVLTGTFVSV